MSCPVIILNVRNGPVSVGDIRITGVTSSSAFLVGDTESFTLYSFFDTPPESVIVGPLVPLPAIPGEDVSLLRDSEDEEGSSSS